MENLVRSNVLKIKSYEPGRPIFMVARQLGLKEVIKLASNENPLGPSPKARIAIAKFLKEINRYPDSHCFYLKKRIAERLKVDESNLLIGNGSDEIIVLASRAFLQQDEEVIIAEPTFLIYEIACQSCGARIVKVPLKDFRYDLKGMKEAITPRTKIVFIANPDNPTGTYVTEKEVEEFLSGLPSSLIVYFDEAYFEFVDKEDYPETLKFLFESNVIITRSFSKAYGLAGLRVGFCVSHPDFIKYMDRIRQPFNVNSLAQVAAYAALEDEAYLARTKRIISEGKSYLYREFERLKIHYIPSVTNFVLLDVGGDGKVVFDALLKKGIVVRDMRAWRLDNFIRVTIGTRQENKKFIKCLEEVLGFS